MNLADLQRMLKINLQEWDKYNGINQLPGYFGIGGGFNNDNIFYDPYQRSTGNPAILPQFGTATDHSTLL